MANYMTFLGDQQILLEAPASGAFSKSELEVQPDPLRALENMLTLIRQVAVHVGHEVNPSLAEAGGALELRFAVRADAFGLVMLSEAADVGQFQCTLKFVPRGNAPRRAEPKAITGPVKED